MKDTLQLNEIAGYLPYGLKFLPTHFNNEKKTYELSYIGSRITDDSGFGINGYGSFFIKPILRPISEWRSLEDGTQFLTPYTHSLVDADGGLEGNIMSIPYTDFVWLLSEHLDVFNLIGRGLAIDKNTLKD